MSRRRRRPLVYARYRSRSQGRETTTNPLFNLFTDVRLGLPHGLLSLEHLIKMRDTYLENEVMSASQPKLRLLLIEGALRFARQSQALTGPDDAEEQCHVLGKLGEIVLHLLRSVESNGTPLACQVRSMYLHLFQLVSLARLEGDMVPIAEVVEVLEIECETWRMIEQAYVDERVTDQPRLTGESPQPAIEFFDAANEEPCGASAVGALQMPRLSLQA